MLSLNASKTPYFLVNPGFLFRRTTARVMLALWFVTMLWLTLGIFPNPKAQANMVPFKSILHDLNKLDHDFVLNFLGNLAGFIPLGFYLPLARTSRTPLTLVIAAGAAVSALIETLQFFSGHRVCDIDDVLLNTTSTVIGFEIALIYIARQWNRTAKASSKLRT